MNGQSDGALFPKLREKTDHFRAISLLHERMQSVIVSLPSHTVRAAVAWMLLPDCGMGRELIWHHLFP
jgi:hypothetical protein